MIRAPAAYLEPMQVYSSRSPILLSLPLGLNDEGVYKFTGNIQQRGVSGPPYAMSRNYIFDFTFSPPAPETEPVVPSIFEAFEAEIAEIKAEGDAWRRK